MAGLDQKLFGEHMWKLFAYGSLMFLCAGVTTMLAFAGSAAGLSVAKGVIQVSVEMWCLWVATCAGGIIAVLRCRKKMFEHGKAMRALLNSVTEPTVAEPVAVVEPRSDRLLLIDATILKRCKNYFWAGMLAVVLLGIAARAAFSPFLGFYQCVGFVLLAMETVLLLTILNEIKRNDRVLRELLR